LNNYLRIDALKCHVDDDHILDAANIIEHAVIAAAQT